MSDKLPANPRPRVIIVGLGSALQSTLASALATIAAQKNVALEFSDKIEPNSKDIQIAIDKTEYVPVMDHKLPEGIIADAIASMVPKKYEYVETRRDEEHPFEKFLKKKKRFT